MIHGTSSKSGSGGRGSHLPSPTAATQLGVSNFLGSRPTVVVPGWQPSHPDRPAYVPVFNGTLGANKTSIQTSNLPASRPTSIVPDWQASPHTDRPVYVPGLNGTLANKTSVQPSIVPSTNGTLESNKTLIRPSNVPLNNGTSSGYRNVTNSSMSLGHIVPLNGTDSNMHPAIVPVQNGTLKANSTAPWRRPIVPLSNGSVKWRNGTFGNGTATNMEVSSMLPSSLFVSGVPMITVTGTPRSTGISTGDTRQALNGTRWNGTTSASVPVGTGTFKLSTPLSAMSAALLSMMSKPTLDIQKTNSSVGNVNKSSESPTAVTFAPSIYSGRWNWTGAGWNETKADSKARRRKARLK